MMTEGGAKRVGLIGWPVAHSVSPAMHNAAFRALGLDWRYELLPTPPDQLQTVVTQLLPEGYVGANVTLPHKQEVARLMDELSDAARIIQAVNTVTIQAGRLWGHNTDAGGFMAALHEAGLEASGKRALVLGAGGAARAVVYGLLRAGCAVSVYNRSPGRASDLAASLKGVGDAILSAVPAEPHSLASLPMTEIDLLVNATPMGMGPNPELSPWPGTLPLPPHWLVFDLVYNPHNTRLLAQAHRAGARGVGGLDMLVHQAARAFELWTECTAPIRVMREAAERALREAALPGGE